MSTVVKFQESFTLWSLLSKALIKTSSDMPPIDYDKTAITVFPHLSNVALEAYQSDGLNIDNNFVQASINYALFHIEKSGDLVYPTLVTPSSQSRSLPPISKYAFEVFSFITHLGDSLDSFVMRVHNKEFVFDDIPALANFAKNMFCYYLTLEISQFHPYLDSLSPTLFDEISLEDMKTIMSSGLIYPLVGLLAFSEKNMAGVGNLFVKEDAIYITLHNQQVLSITKAKADDFGYFIEIIENVSASTSEQTKNLSSYFKAENIRPLKSNFSHQRIFNVSYNIFSGAIGLDFTSQLVKIDYQALFGGN